MNWILFGVSIPEKVDLGDGFDAVSLALGAWHSCFMSSDGSLKCFGFNYYGQLGYEDTENRGDEEGEMGNALPVINFGSQFVVNLLAVSGPRAEHLCAADSVGSFGSTEWKCWGFVFPACFLAVSLKKTTSSHLDLLLSDITIGQV